MELKSEFKRNTAYKLKIGDIAAGKPIVDADKLKFLELGDKQVVRVNIIANIIDKYIQEGEKKFGSLTIDDGSGQIKIKSFGEDVDKFNQFTQGDTILIIGLLRQWNNEIYITSEILKKKGEKVVLLGNEALIRGALESGVQFISTYPGTPASEIGNIFHQF